MALTSSPVMRVNAMSLFVSISTRDRSDLGTSPPDEFPPAPVTTMKHFDLLVFHAGAWKKSVSSRIASK